MTASSRPAMGSPLFYRLPQPLSSREHAHWRLREGDYGFTEEANAVPLMLGEFAAALRHYPIVFAGDGASPIAVLGLESRNLFVTQGRWAPATYVPAYVRRYPFLSMAIESPEQFVLAIDGASPHLVTQGEEAGEEDAGVALFDGDAPSTLTRRMQGFCEVFRDDHAATLAWVTALKTQGVLDGRHAAVTLPSGRQLALGGFQAVDPQRLAKLDDEVIVDWQRKGWLAGVHLHLASLERFADLLERQGQAEPAPPRGDATAVAAAA